MHSCNFWSHNLRMKPSALRAAAYPQRSPHTKEVAIHARAAEPDDAKSIGVTIRQSVLMQRDEVVR